MADMTLEEALEAATVDEELISPVNEVLMINPETRTINVPDSEKMFGVRQDMSAERKYFKCPRIVGDNIDLFEHYVFVNYIPSDQNGKYESEKDVQGYWCRDLAVEGDFITFSWELTENVLRKAGYIAFAVYAKVSDENGNLKTKWHTTIAIGNVLDTLPDGEECITTYPDIVTQLLERMDAVEKIANPESMQEYVDDYFNRNPMMIDRELKDSTKAAPADIVGKLSEDIATKANAIKETASGEVIVVTDSAEQKPLGFAIDGKSEQDQYSGNQLLDLSSFKSATNSGVTIENKGDGSCSVIGTATSSAGNIWLYGGYGRLPNADDSNVILTLKAGKTYYIKDCCVYGSYDGTSFVDFAQSSFSDRYKIKIANSDFKVTGIRNPIFTVDKAYNDIIYPIVAESDVEVPWEPYCGGIPSPNTDYQQEIVNCGVYDEASGKYAVEVKCTGKNLLDVFKFNNHNLKKDGVSIKVNDNGSITAIGTSSGYPQIAQEITLQKASYTLSGANTETLIRVRLYKFDGSYKDCRCGSIFTIDDTVESIRVMVQVSNGITVDETFFPMLCYAEITDNTYEPCKETTATVYLDEPLRKGDKVYWNGGSKVRIDRYRDVKVINKTTRLDSSGKLFHVGSFANVVKVSSAEVVGGNLCNKYIEYSLTRLRNSEKNGMCQYMREFYVRDNRYSTIEEFSAYLEENPFEIEASLEEPITEEIDLSLDGLSMFYPTTVISNDCNANMEVTYIADTKAYVDKKITEVITAML